ncbi:MAG: cyclic pyranopterin monophosphate synthase MoaC [Deltaproteobacteria bacterium]|nr:cyclic pyranopterin monophosphate synthase MoaC [Deltaproteobacteria bacterium]
MALTHIDERGKAKMVDVTGKDATERAAVAKGRVKMKKETLDLIIASEVKKGDVLGVARVAGIMAAKKTGELIPLCHPLNITSVEVDFNIVTDDPSVEITATARVASKTGVEMEALTAASVAALTIYDMCKAADKGMTITDIRLVKKTGGKSGDFTRE